MNSTPIQWTDATWNPVRGCSRVSEGCRNCYAERTASRFQTGTFSGFVQITNGHPQWTGKVEVVLTKVTEPLHWTKPRRIFVNSMSDLFHESLTDSEIAGLLTVMANSHIATGREQTHTFQILTKRARRMRDFIKSLRWRIGMGLLHHGPESHIVNCMPIVGDWDPWSPLTPVSSVLNEAGLEIRRATEWMPPQIHLGVSVEDEPTFLDRVPFLLETPASVRFLSYEPALGPIHAAPYLGSGPNRINWVIAGGESGPGARPANPNWFRPLREQCQRLKVPFFFKQWGEWAPASDVAQLVTTNKPWGNIDQAGQFQKCKTAWHDTGINITGSPGRVTMIRIGRRNSGRLLDGREWNEFPA